jgi:hypothetical protein
MGSRPQHICLGGGIREGIFSLNQNDKGRVIY